MWILGNCPIFWKTLNTFPRVNLFVIVIFVTVWCTDVNEWGFYRGFNWGFRLGLTLIGSNEFVQGSERSILVRVLGGWLNTGLCNVFQSCVCGILDNFVVALWEGILGGTLVQRYPDIDLNSAAPPHLGCSAWPDTQLVNAQPLSPFSFYQHWFKLVGHLFIFALSNNIWQGKMNINLGQKKWSWTLPMRGVRSS